MQRRRERAAVRCRRKFLRFFPGGFADPTYLDWERNYKAEASARWQAELSRARFGAMLARRQFVEAASLAVRIESRTNLLYSFEKMALRDAVRSPAGARPFTEGLYDFLHGGERPRARFDAWCETVGRLPVRQTRVRTWPILTVFGFIAAPAKHIFLKPLVTRSAAEAYQFDFEYRSQPAWPTYASLLAFAETVRRDVADLKPRDMIDLQSFIWVQGSDEYDE